MSTQINPVRNATPLVARDVPPVTLAERVQKLEEKSPDHDDDRREPACEMADLVVGQLFPMPDTILVTLPSVGRDAAMPLGGRAGEMVPEESPGQGRQVDTSRWQGQSQSAGATMVFAPAVEVTDSSPMPRPVFVSGQDIGSDARVRPSETEIRTNDTDEARLRPTSNSRPTVVPLPADNETRGDGVSTSSRGKDTLPTPMPAQPGTAPTPAIPTNDPHAAMATTTGQTLFVPSPSRSGPPGQGRASEALPASTELTFAFRSWGDGEAVTATLARSGYVYLHPSSDRVGAALTASKPEERWMVERAGATGEDDNGKQRRKRR